jgi:hypothetical protein
LTFLALSPRIWIALGLLFLYALLRRLIKQWLDTRRRTTAPRSTAAIPSRITNGADRTWVVFTTPMCTTCDPVVDRLRAAEPSSKVVKIDATIERDLADSFRIRTAPTAVLADARGVVHAQLVGVDAVTTYLDGTT